MFLFILCSENSLSLNDTFTDYSLSYINEGDQTPLPPFSSTIDNIDRGRYEMIKKKLKKA